MTKDVNRNEVSSSDNNGVISFVIAVALIVILVAFLAFGFDKKNRNFENLDNVSKEKLAQDKYYSISSMRNILTNDLIFFSDKSVDVNNIDMDKLLYVAYFNINSEDRVTKGTVSDDCYLSDNLTKDNYPDKCFIEIVDKNILDEQIRIFFSSKANISYNDFIISSNQKCSFKDNIYSCYLDRSPLKMNNYNTISKYDSYEYVDDKLIVYSYLLSIRDSYDKNYEMGIYSDSKATLKIDDLNYYENDIHKTITQETVAKLIEHYKDNISKYKSTFVKENNNYVWYSTELIK